VPDGAPTSTLDAPAPAPVAVRAPQGDRERPGPGPAPGGLDPLLAIVDALDREADIDILYAGARGLSSRRITPFELDGARLHAWCHLRDDERTFWLQSIRDAQPAKESRRSAG
jgi:predicted DNA-binding transcriptional regulator YafY